MELQLWKTIYIIGGCFWIFMCFFPILIFMYEGSLVENLQFVVLVTAMYTLGSSFMIMMLHGAYTEENKKRSCKK